MPSTGVPAGVGVLAAGVLSTGVPGTGVPDAGVPASGVLTAGVPTTGVGVAVRSMMVTLSFLGSAPCWEKT